MSIESIGKSTIYIDNKQAEEAMRQLANEVDKYSAKMNEARKANDKAGFDKAKKEYARANRELKSYKTTIYDVTKVLNNLSGTSYNTLIKVQRKLERELRGMNKTTKEEITLYKQKIGQLKKVKAETVKVRKEMAAGSRATQGWMSKMANGFNKYSMMIASFAASITGIIFSLRKAIDTSNDFDASVSNLSAMTGLVGKDLDELSKRATDFSGSTTKAGIRITQSAKDIVDAYVLMGSARPELLKNADALATVTEKAITLSVAQRMELKPAVDAVAASMNQFDLKANQSSRIINTLAAGSLKGSAFVQDLTDSLKNVGTVADGSNMSLEQTVAMLEILAKKQLKGEEAGTQMRSAILRLKAAGVGYQSGLFNLKDALDEVNGRLAQHSTAAEKDAIIMKIFGKRQITAGTIMLNNVDAYVAMTKAVTGTNIAMEQAATNTDNNKARLDAARQSLNNYVIALGRKLTPALTFSTSAFSHTIKAVLTLMKFYNENRKVILTLTSAIIAYTVATKISVAWDKIHYTYLIAKEAITKAYAFTTSILTGKVKLATIAQKLWNTAQKNNPIGLIVGILIAAGTALYLYTRKLSAAEKAQKELNKVNLEARKSIVDEKVKLEILLRTAKNETLSKEKRLKAIKDLNALSPEYLGNLNLETINTIAAKKATDNYISSLLKKARVEAAKQKLIEVEKKLIDLQINPEKQFSFIQKTGVMMTSFGNVSKAAQKEVSNLNLKENQLLATKELLLGIINKTNEAETKTTKATTPTVTTPLSKAYFDNQWAEDLKNWKESRKAYWEKREKADKEYKKKYDAAQNKPFFLEDKANVKDESEYLIGIYRNTYAGKLDLLNAFHDAGIISDKEYNDKVIELEAEKNQRLKQMQEDLQSYKNQVLQQGINTAFQLFDMAAKAQYNRDKGNLTKEENQEMKSLQKKLEAKTITNEQYNARTDAIKQKYAEKDLKLRQKEAKLEKEMSALKIAITTAETIFKIQAQAAVYAAGVLTAPLAAVALAQIPWVLASAALELALVAAQPIPQYAKGNILQVLGAGDGQTYNAQLTDSNHQSGLFNEPTYVPGFGLFGETKTPELVFNPYDTQKIMNTPALVQALKFTLGNSQQYASGNAREIIRENNTTQMFTDPALIELLQKIDAKLDEPARAELIADEDYIRTHNRVKNDYENFQKRVGM